MNINLTPELAEICGIHVGDGYLRYGKRNEFDVSGGIEEKDYYDNHVKNLFKKVFNIEIDCRYFKSRNTYGFVIRDKEIIKFMNSLGFPLGAKSTRIQVPEVIFNSNDINIISRFLRGYFDTDGCLHFWKRNKGKYSDFKKNFNYYPLVIVNTISKKLFQQVLFLLKKLGFEKVGNYVVKRKKSNEKLEYTIRLYGKNNLIHFMNQIGFKNPVKLSRFQIWKKLGHCPSRTTFKQRVEILKNPNNISKILGARSLTWIEPSPSVKFLN